MPRQWYTFMHPEASKGNALKMILSSAGDVDPRRAVAFGDNINDKSMFLVNGVFGVAVLNAKDELKAAAKAITGSHEDPENAGVASALNRISKARQERMARSSKPLEQTIETPGSKRLKVGES